MSVQQIVNEALQRARSTAGGGTGTAATKTASAEDALIKTAHQLADANEWIALSAADDGTAGGRARRGLVENFFKSAGGEKVPGPVQSESPTGTQAVPPQSGAKKILPLGKASGDSPEESGAPTGTQATLDQTGTKKAGMTLLDAITKSADTSAIPGPKQSVAGENAAAPPPKNENTNIGALRSAEGMVSMTRREAKAPTRDRLKQLFAHAGDTGPSSAAAQAAFPNAYAKGGMKEAAADPRDAIDDKLLGESKASMRESGIKAVNTAGHAGRGAVHGALGGAAGGILAGSGVGLGVGALGGALSQGARARGGLGSRLAGAGLGALVGGAAGGVTGGMIGAVPGGLAGGISGGISGHRAGQREQRAMDAAEAAHEKLDAREKKASVSDYAKLASLAESGSLGDAARELIRFADGLVT
jgi:hypothetical protein